MSKENDRTNVELIDVQTVNLGISDYDTLDIETVKRAIQHLELNQLSAVWKYERQQQNRKPVLRAIYNRMASNPKVLKSELQRETEKGFTILMVGQIGVGKSETVNSLFGKKVAETNEFTAETKVVTPFAGTYNRVNYTIYDTPGLGEWDIGEVELDEKYLSLMREQCPSPDVLWYVLRLDDRRVRAEDAKTLQLIHQNFGDRIWDRTMIVFTHADRVSEPEDFHRVFDGRAKSVNNVIADVTKGKGQDLPVVAVANKQKHTPDGTDWLGELFTTSVEQLNPERLTAFLFAFADDLGAPKIQKPKADASEETTQKIENRIQLTQEQVIRVGKKLTGASKILGVAVEGAILGLATAAETVIEGIVGFISRLRNR